MPPYEDPLVRFWRKVDKNGPNGCWLWTAGANHGGYGQFCISYGHMVLAHRHAYELLVGPLPASHPVKGVERLVLDHLCRVRRCVNPQHLELITNQENIARGPLFRTPRGITAINVLKTHCPKGHPYSKENTYLSPDGRRRSCRACDALKRERRRAERAAG